MPLMMSTRHVGFNPMPSRGKSHATCLRRPLRETEMKAKQASRHLQKITAVELRHSLTDNLLARYQTNYKRILNTPAEMH